LLAFECGRLGGLRVLARRIRSSDDAQGANPGPVLTWAARNGRWQLMASLLMALNPLVDILFARTLGAGAVTTVEYASRLWNVIPLLFAGYLTLMYAKMSRGVASGSGNVMTRLHTRAVAVGLAGAAVTGVAMLGVEPTIQFVYGFGVMDFATRAELSHLLMAYLVGASPFVASLVYVRAFSAQGRVDVLAWVAVANVGTNLMLDAVLIRWVGLVGIGLATAGSYAVTLALFVWVMSRITPNEAISSRPD
jgi:peptidoglycan biosynthesis protein MviN/MurJ (putative lipid II flippase)